MKFSGARLFAMGFLMTTIVSARAVEAANLVTFTRGQSIVVQSVEKRGIWYYFVLDGGGEMGVPASRVSRIEEYEAPPASAVPAAPAPPVSMQTSSAPQGSAASPAGQPAADNAGQPGQPAVAAQNSQDNSNVLSHDRNENRFRARMTGGPAIQQGGGGMRKPAGMIGGRVGGNPGDPTQNPYYRRNPPTQPGSPTQ